MSKFKKLDYDFIKKIISSSSKESSIYIGCDSKLTGPYTLFGLVVVIHIDSHHGASVYGKRLLVDRRMDMKDRLMREVDYAMEAAFSLNDFIGDRNFEVHLDINGNPKHKSNVVMKQAVAYVKAQGFICKIKPGAWAASTAADYLIH